MNVVTDVRNSIPTTPGQITANQDHYNPEKQVYFQCWTSDASRDVTGMTFNNTVLPGEEHLITNVGAQDIVLKHQDAGSTAANRFLAQPRPTLP